MLRQRDAPGDFILLPKKSSKKFGTIQNAKDYFRILNNLPG